jgi:hypothetical protein
MPAQIARRVALVALSLAAASHGVTRTVGPTGTYAKPCQAIAAAADGDTIEIDAAGTYAGDVCQIAKNGLTLRGVNGRAKIDAAGQSSGGKAIWVISGNDTTVENVELTGASVPDMNGAGIRQEGANLTVRGCYFHDNQDGILAGDNSGSQILIEHTEFDHNGAGDGYSHNLYINHVAKLTFRYNWSHRAVTGHLLKSRAAETYVLENRLTGEADGTESYEIDVPNGGKTYVIGNLVEQGKNTGNSVMLAYQEEGANAANPGDALFVASNTFVDDRGGGTFVSVGTSVATPARLVNNVFVGGGAQSNQASAMLQANYAGNAPGFVDSVHYDYHLAAGSPCVGGGVDPGSGGGYSLIPTEQYVHPASSEPRVTVGVIDIGAYEFGSAPADAGASGGGTGGVPASNGGAGTGGRAAGSGGAAPAGSSGTSAGSGRAGGSATGGSVVTGAGGAKAGIPDGPTPVDAGTHGDSSSASCGCHAVGRTTSSRGAPSASDVGGAAGTGTGMRIGVLIIFLRSRAGGRRARLLARLSAL